MHTLRGSNAHFGGSDAHFKVGKLFWQVGKLFWQVGKFESQRGLVVSRTGHLPTIQLGFWQMILFLGLSCSSAVLSFLLLAPGK